MGEQEALQASVSRRREIRDPGPGRGGQARNDHTRHGLSPFGNRAAGEGRREGSGPVFPGLGLTLGTAKTTKAVGIRGGLQLPGCSAPPAPGRERRLQARGKGGAGPRRTWRRDAPTATSEFVCATGSR